jgi:hypothetical protein
VGFVAHKSLTGPPDDYDIYDSHWKNWDDVGENRTDAKTKLPDRVSGPEVVPKPADLVVSYSFFLVPGISIGR